MNHRHLGLLISRWRAVALNAAAVCVLGGVLTAAPVLAAQPQKSPPSPELQEALKNGLIGAYVPLIVEAANLGNPQAQLILGDACLLGDRGFSKDPPTAIAWYRKAADQGYTPAMRKLGYVYGSDEYIPLDKALGRQWYQRAADLGDPFAQRVIGAMYGIDKNLEETYFWMLLATHRGNPEASKARDYAASQLSADQRKRVKARVLKWKPVVFEWP